MIISLFYFSKLNLHIMVFGKLLIILFFLQGDTSAVEDRFQIAAGVLAQVAIKVHRTPPDT
ncbi:hypothetical protein CF112_16070 [Aeromonas hydrophila]|nr:hypothetical protein CF112_16070 [Aeromonas hydrophila]